MREILFRGKQVDNGEWVYGSLLKQAGEYISKDEVTPNECWICGMRGEKDLIVSETVGQYTGLKDLHNTRIFEGDVCKAYICKAADTVEKEVVGVICFEDGTFEFKCEHENIYLYPLIDVLEVIGNVFDNPDFLRWRKMTDLAPCRYCDGKIKQYTHEGRNFTGQQGYISVCYCIRCGMQVEAFDENPIEAERKAAGYWNRGIYDRRGK